MLNIIGGSYYEVCVDPIWNELYGSGFRAVAALANRNTDITFYTYADTETSEILTTLTEHLSIKLETTTIEESIEFIYEHPLANPFFYPLTSSFKNLQPLKVINSINAICFGMLEGNAVVISEKVVYDPQQPENPESFWSNGSKAKDLVIVLNYVEAEQLAKASDLDTIASYLLNKENAKAAVIKNGAEGAYVFQKNKETVVIPCFITSKVWPIGSGDIYSSSLGFEWMVNNETIESAAYKASLATAYYANSKTLPIPNTIEPFQEIKINKKNKKTAYLAGPFFTMSQRWMINQFRNALSTNLNVFSPYHDVGIGSAEEVVHLDIKAIHKCDILVAILDGLDSGTLYEIGYARAIGKPVIAFVENESANALTMLEGTACIIENDFSTVIYKTVWEAYK